MRPAGTGLLARRLLLPGILTTPTLCPGADKPAVSDRDAGTPLGPGGRNRFTAGAIFQVSGNRG